jgi:flagellar hook-associated protein 3 FlgL
MRVTQNMLREQALRSLTLNQEALARIQEQVSTTKQLNRPSDDPAQVRAAIKLREGVAELEQYIRNTDTAARTVQGAETAIASAGNAIQRARELAIQGANDTLSASDRQNMAVEVDQLAAQLVQLAAAKVGTSYIFSGFRTDLPPYAAPTGVYQGDANAVMARVAPGNTIQVNIPGDVAFGSALAALTQLQAELAAGSRVSAATISAIDTGQVDLLTARATLGARQNRLDEVRVYLEDGILTARRLLSDIEDVDMPKAISELSARQATYEAALRVNARLLQNSLLDELR